MQLLALQIFTLYILYILAETFAICFRVCNSRIDNPLKYTTPFLYMISIFQFLYQ